MEDSAPSHGHSRLDRSNLDAIHSVGTHSDEAGSYVDQPMEMLPDEKDPRRKQVETLLE